MHGKKFVVVWLVGIVVVENVGIPANSFGGKRQAKVEHHKHETSNVRLAARSADKIQHNLSHSMCSTSHHPLADAEHHRTTPIHQQQQQKHRRLDQVININKRMQS